MNTTPPIAELFTTKNLVASGISQVTEELLDAAIDRFALVLEAIPTASGEWVLYFVGEPPVRILLARPSLFRTVLARIASVGTTETDRDVNPYGDRFTITRHTSNGPVHLEVDFQNTPGLQRLRIVCVPTSVIQPAKSSVVIQS